MDPIYVIRDFVVNGRLEEIAESGSEIDFGGSYSYRGTAPTAYKSQQGKGDFYDVQSVLFFARSLGPEFKFMDYFKAAKERGLMQVKMIDNKVSMLGRCDA